MTRAVFVPVLILLLVACGDEGTGTSQSSSRMGPNPSAGPGAAGTAGVGGSGGMGGSTAGTAGSTVAGTGGSAGAAGSVAGMGAAGEGAAGAAAGSGGTAGGDSDTDLQVCVMRAMDRGSYAGRETCVDCSCGACGAELELCENSPDQAKNDLCMAVVSCGQDNGCRGTECYCGIGVSTLECLTPQGPCVAQIEAAAGTSGATNVNSVKDSGDMENPLVRANAVGVCARGNPATDGLPPIIPAADAILGNCEAECN